MKNAPKISATRTWERDRPCRAKMAVKMNPPTAKRMLRPEMKIEADGNVKLTRTIIPQAASMGFFVRNCTRALMRMPIPNTPLTINRAVYCQAPLERSRLK